MPVRSAVSSAAQASRKLIRSRGLLHSRPPRRIAGIDGAGREFELLAGVHVLEARLLGIVHDRNVSSPDPIRVLERALERAARELELGGEAGAACLAGELERGEVRRLCVAVGERDQEVDDVGRGRLLRRRQQDPLDARGEADAGVGCPPSCSIRRS